MYETPITGLVLSGGGARAAYQVGVLQTLAKLRRRTGADLSRNPFAVICGTSAGALNSAALATQSDRFDKAVSDLADVWHNFRVEQVYRSDSLGVIRSGAPSGPLATAGSRAVAWRGRHGLGQRRARRGAGQLLAVRVGLHP